jgi:hypothetical protein
MTAVPEVVAFEVSKRTCYGGDLLWKWSVFFPI